VNGASEPDLRAVGDRIEVLLDELRSSLDPRVWELVEETVGLVTELYGGGLERVLELVSDDIAERLAADDLLATLFVLHDLHPHDLESRVRSALRRRAGEVDVVHIDEERGVVDLRVVGSDDGSVERDLLRMVPELTEVNVLKATPVTLGKKPVAAR
jgi:Fe-S cluster biogenesis protein NfuA